MAALGQSDDVTLTYGTLLKVNQPLLKAVNVKNVFAHGNFHQLLTLLKVLKTQSALSLIRHVRIVNSILLVPRLIDFTSLYRVIPDPVHDLEVNADDCFRLVVNLLLVLKITISVSYLRVAHHLRVSLFVLGPEEADHFNKYYDEEEKDGPGN